MGDLVRQLECLSCSNKRSFVRQTAAGPCNLNQADVARLPNQVGIACGRCGGTNLIVCWDDGFPYRAPETIQLRRKRGSVAAPRVLPN
jgi:hypothetical protein